MDKITGIKWIGWYKDRVRTLLPVGETVRAKDIIEKARQQHMNPNKVYECLEIMMKEGEVKKFKDKPKEAYYVRYDEVRIKRLMEDFTKGINAKFSEFPEEMSSLMERTANAILEEYKEKGVELPKEEAKKMLMENPIFVEEMGFLSFTKAVFEAFKVLLHTKVARHEDFFIDKEGYIVPSAEVYKRFTPSEIEEYNKISSSDN